MTRTTDVNTESRIALFAGGDLDERSAAELERRIATCPEARSCHEEMEESLAVLHRCRDESAEVEEGRSLWPRLANRLPMRQTSGALESLRPWVPAFTVAALVLALLTVATTPPPRSGTVPFADGMSSSRTPGPDWFVRAPEPMTPAESMPAVTDRHRVPYYLRPQVDFDTRGERTSPHTEPAGDRTK